VIFADDHLVVLDKSSGILVAADRYDQDAPRLDILAESQFGRLFAVHRIDRETSGLVTYARTAEAHRSLSMQFEERRVVKIYRVLIHGRLPGETISVDVPLLPDGDKRHRTVANQQRGKPSRTAFRQIARRGHFAWVEARPETGRTHQIRVHLATLGLSVVCDALYGSGKPLILSQIKRSWRGDPLGERPLLDRLALHAYFLELTHPATGERVTFEAPLHRDMLAAWNQLEKIYPEPVEKLG
jgi:RluA family pseudouridine synthase